MQLIRGDQQRAACPARAAWCVVQQHSRLQFMSGIGRDGNNGEPSRNKTLF